LGWGMAEFAALLAMQTALRNDDSPIRVVGEGQYEDL
jgi:hypothetical protein